MSTESASTAFISSARLIESFQSDCRIRGMAPGSIPRYLSVIRIFCRFLDSQCINLLNVDRDVLRSFIEYMRLDRGIAQKTLENYFTVLSSLYEYLTYEEYSYLPAFGMRYFKKLLHFLEFKIPNSLNSLILAFFR